MSDSPTPTEADPAPSVNYHAVATIAAILLAIPWVKELQDVIRQHGWFGGFQSWQDVFFYWLPLVAGIATVVFVLRVNKLAVWLVTGVIVVISVWSFLENGYWNIPWTSGGLLFILGAAAVTAYSVHAMEAPEGAKGPSRAEVRRQEFAQRQHDARVQQIKDWEQAYRDAHDGAEPPEGYRPPVTAAVPTDTGTNGVAIAGFVFGLLGGLLGIIFGFVALSQIKKTGQGGRGLAIAGIVMSFIWIAVAAVFFITALSATSDVYWY